jgi:hypothetical protein
MVVKFSAYVPVSTVTVTFWSQQCGDEYTALRHGPSSPPVNATTKILFDGTSGHAWRMYSGGDVRVVESIEVGTPVDR